MKSSRRQFMNLAACAAALIVQFIKSFSGETIKVPTSKEFRHDILTALACFHVDLASFDVDLQPAGNITRPAAQTEACRQSEDRRAQPNSLHDAVEPITARGSHCLRRDYWRHRS